MKNITHSDFQRKKHLTLSERYPGSNWHNGFETTNIDRMYKKNNDGKVYKPLILVHQPKTYTNKKTFNLTNICQMKIRVEAQWTKTIVIQSHWCQNFGHNQARCKQKPRCVNCGQNHTTSECTRPRNIKPKYATAEDHTTQTTEDVDNFQKQKPNQVNSQTDNRQPANPLPSAMKK